MTTELPLGYAVIGDRSVDDVLSWLGTLGAVIVRDVVVGPPGSAAKLTPKEGDFWFHSDGVFLANPPRFVVIQIVRAEMGGALWVLDSAYFAHSLPKVPVRFGTEHHFTVSLPIQDTERGQIFRYREDYMAPDKGDPTHLDEMRSLIRSAACRFAVPLGELAEGTILLLDNWRVLHRREDFRGDRTIRRIWLN